METFSLTVITPTVRPQGCEIVAKSLRKQDFRDFEWLIVAPEHLRADVEGYTVSQPHIFVPEPPKREGDFWNLSKAWNKAYAFSKGQLIVNVQDMVWLPPDTLSRFWQHYKNNPKALVTAVGHHYSDIDSIGKPSNLVWQDPRARMDIGTFYKVSPSEMEMCVCSIPKQAIIDCGGMDEEYDKGPGVGEKELSHRVEKLGYDLYIDQSIEYRGVKHGRLTEDWDEKYFSVTAPLFTKHIKDLLNGERPLNVGCLSGYNI